MTLIYHTPLDAETQAAHGIRPAQPLAMADRVRFSEIDALHHVNNVAYMSWFERMRIRYMQDWGISGYDSADDPRIVIRSGHIHYRQEMLLDEDYIATCGCVAWRSSSFSLRQQVWSDGMLRTTFDCVIVLLTPDGSGKYPIPQAVTDRLARIDGAERDIA
jgi:acyl-CoA thioester hydrolase